MYFIMAGRVAAFNDLCVHSATGALAAVFPVSPRNGRGFFLRVEVVGCMVDNYTTSAPKLYNLLTFLAGGTNFFFFFFFFSDLPTCKKLSNNPTDGV